MVRRPVPAPEPSPGAWWTVVLSLGRLVVEGAVSALHVVTFGFVRARWKREIAARVAAGALPEDPTIRAVDDRGTPVESQ